MYVSTLTSKSPLEGGNVPTRGRAVEAKSASGGYAPASTPTVGTASGGNAPARVPTPASGSYAPARRSHPLTPVQGHYFSKCIPCGLSWGSHDLPEARRSTCNRPVTMFVGTEIRPPSRGRTPTPPPAPVHSVGAVRSPDPAPCTQYRSSYASSCTDVGG